MCLLFLFYCFIDAIKKGMLIRDPCGANKRTMRLCGEGENLLAAGRKMRSPMNFSKNWGGGGQTTYSRFLLSQEFSSCPEALGANGCSHFLSSSSPQSPGNSLWKLCYGSVSVKFTDHFCCGMTGSCGTTVISTTLRNGVRSMHCSNSPLTILNCV